MFIQSRYYYLSTYYIHVWSTCYYTTSFFTYFISLTILHKVYLKHAFVSTLSLIFTSQSHIILSSVVQKENNNSAIISMTQNIKWVNQLGLFLSYDLRIKKVLTKKAYMFIPIYKCIKILGIYVCSNKDINIWSLWPKCLVGLLFHQLTYLREYISF